MPDDPTIDARVLSLASMTLSEALRQYVVQLTEMTIGYNAPISRMPRPTPPRERRPRVLTRRQAIKAADEKALRALTENPSAGPDGHIGDFVFWSIPTDWRMPCPDVAAILLKHGLDPVPLMPEATPYERAFTRAVESVRASVRSLGYTLAEAKDGPRGEKRINVLHTTKADVLDPEDQGSILCATTGNVRPFVERADPGGVTSKIYDKTLDLVGVYKKADLSISVAQLLRRWSAMPLLDGGYLLPPGGEAEINAMKAAMEEMGAGFIGQLGCYAKDQRSVKTAAHGVNMSLEAQLNAFNKAAKEYSNRTDSVRKSTIEKAIEEACNLKKQANMYRVLLGVAVENIDDRIAAVEKTLRDTLSIQEETESYQ